MGKLIARQSTLSTDRVPYFLTSLLIAQQTIHVGTMIHILVHCIGALRYQSHEQKIKQNIVQRTNKRNNKQVKIWIQQTGQVE